MVLVAPCVFSLFACLRFLSANAFAFPVIAPFIFCSHSFPSLSFTSLSFFDLSRISCLHSGRYRFFHFARSSIASDFSRCFVYRFLPRIVAVSVFQATTIRFDEENAWIQPFRQERPVHGDDVDDSCSVRQKYRLRMTWLLQRSA